MSNSSLSVREALALDHHTSSEAMRELQKSISCISNTYAPRIGLSAVDREVHPKLTAMLILRDIDKLTEAFRQIAPSCRITTSDDDLTGLISVKYSDRQANIKIPSLNSTVNFSPFAARLVDLIPFLNFSAEVISFEGDAIFDLGDGGNINALSFSQREVGAPLIADCNFFSSNAYALERFAFSGSPAFKLRSPDFFWRGATTGQRIDGWRSLSRIKLCTLAKSYSKHPSFDVGITNVVQSDYASEFDEIAAAGLIKREIPSIFFANYRYHIDIDGNTNSWPGLFIKLLTGSPVLKIASAHGNRQWYYNRLEPWYNYVPILSDMSDLVEKAQWLENNETKAMQIGVAGRELALSMSLEGEALRSIARVEAFLAAR
jgi:hypothetical protein